MDVYHVFMTVFYGQKDYYTGIFKLPRLDDFACAAYCGHYINTNPICVLDNVPSSL